MHANLVDYCHHFKLEDKFHLNTPVSQVTRDDAQGRWLAHIQGEEGPKCFDKVVVANGINAQVKVSSVEDLVLFKGQTLHSRPFKRCVGA